MRDSPGLDRRHLCALAVAATAAGGLTTSCSGAVRPRPPTTFRQLPPPDQRGAMTVVEALRSRRSVRAFSTRPLTVAELGQLLWAAQGVTHGEGLRTAPSAGALYPLEIYAVTRTVVSHYRPDLHGVEEWSSDAAWPEVVAATISHEAVRTAPAAVVVTAVVGRSAGKYGVDADKYVAMEAGHAAQNVLLQAVALGLGAVPLGALDHQAIAAALSLARGEVAYYVIPVGQGGS